MCRLLQWIINSAYTLLIKLHYKDYIKASTANELSNETITKVSEALRFIFNNIRESINQGRLYYEFANDVPGNDYIVLLNYDNSLTERLKIEPYFFTKVCNYLKYRGYDITINTVLHTAWYIAWDKSNKL